MKNNITNIYVVKYITNKLANYTLTRPIKKTFLYNSNGIKTRKKTFLSKSMSRKCFILDKKESHFERFNVKLY